MGLGDLTLLLVGRDALAQQLHVHLEHRGADIERAEAREALDTIRVAIPDLVILSEDASGADAERIRDGLTSSGNASRLLVLCAKKDAGRTGTYKLDFVATLEPELGAELIASSIESLCTLLDKKSSAGRPLRSLVADVRRAQMPARRTAPMLVAPPAVGIAAPKPIAAPTPVAVAPIAAPPPAAVVIAAPRPATLIVAVPPPAAVAIAAPKEEDTDLTVEISVATVRPTAPIEPAALQVSLPPPLPRRVSLATPSLPTPPAMPAPVVVLAPVQAPDEEPPLRSKPLWAQISRRHQAIALAAVVLLAIGAFAISGSDDDHQPIAKAASASLSNVAQQVAKPAAPAVAAKPRATVALPSPAAPQPPAIAALPEPATQTGDELEGGAVEGESYDPNVDPARARANFHVNTGHRLRKEGRLGMAEASYLKALESFPTYARAVSGLVEVHLARRDGVEALRWAKKLIALQPKRGVHQRLLGDAFALTGSKAQAREAWQLAIRLGDRASRSRL